MAETQQQIADRQAYDALFAQQFPNEAAYYAGYEESPYLIRQAQLQQGGLPQPQPGSAYTGGPLLPDLLSQGSVAVAPLTTAAPLKTITPTKQISSQGLTANFLGIDCNVCDPFSDCFDPEQCQLDYGPPGSGIQVPTVQGVSVSVGIPISISNTVENNVSDLVSGVISGAADQVGNAFSKISGDIINNLNQYVYGLQDFVNSAFGNIGSTISNIGGAIVSGLGTALHDIFSGVGDVLGGIKDALGSIADAVTKKFTDLIQAIKDNGFSAILPVINLIVTEIQNTRNIIAAIETDIHAGVGALILLPTQISQSLGSLDASLNRALQQLGINKMPTIDSNVKLGGADFPANFIEQISLGLSTGAVLNGPASTIDSLAAFSETCIAPDVVLELQKIKTSMATLPGWAQWLFQAGVNLIQAFTVVGSLIVKQGELGEEKANELCPIEKLSPADYVQAMQRGFITTGAMNSELLKLGYNSDRVSTLVKLAAQELGYPVLQDALYRGDITNDVFVSGLHTLGFSDSQISILQNQSKYLPSLNELVRWSNFGFITGDQFDAGLKALRYQPDQINAIHNTLLQPISTSLDIAIQGRLTALDNNFPTSLAASLPPDSVNLAAQREGLRADVAQAMWLAHWQYPSYGLVTQAMFRNLRTQADVNASMAAQNIPAEFWNELTQIQRPLLPLRSLATYYKAGVITEAEMVLELNSHGYDPLHIKWLVDYANKTTTSKTATAVAATATLSVQTARTLFQDGVINQAQYVQILEAHKYPPDLAVLQAEADVMHAETTARKQTITDLIDEVLAGLVTVDDAMTQLHQQSFTLAEIARFQKGIRSANTKIAKHPSIPDMKTFLKAGLITLDQFKSELQLQGWSDPWLTAWVNLETPTPA